MAIDQVILTVGNTEKIDLMALQRATRSTNTTILLTLLDEFLSGVDWEKPTAGAPPLRSLYRRKKLAYGPVEPPPVIVNTIPQRSVRAIPLLIRLARSALPMRWGTYQGAF